VTVTTPTTVQATSSTLTHQGSTVPTSTTTVPGTNQHLPFTGSGTFFPVIFGMCSVAAGGSLMLRRRRAWSDG
jgi:LPXTG-motif cell wall-anchored protein